MSKDSTGITGIIGGTGLYSIEGLKLIAKKNVTTPFGKPSAPIAIGKFGDQKVAFLPRHGLKHTILPSEINFRANIWALKSVGVRRIISVSATGSLQQEIAPGSLVLPDQYFDLTKGKREASFFGKGMVGHVSSAEPVCPSLVSSFRKAAESVGVPLHTGKTYAWIVKSTALVNHYYFYCVDRDSGPAGADGLRPDPGRADRRGLARPPRLRCGTHPRCASRRKAAGKLLVGRRRLPL